MLIFLCLSNVLLIELQDLEIPISKQDCNKCRSHGGPHCHCAAKVDDSVSDLLNMDGMGKTVDVTEVPSDQDMSTILEEDDQEGGKEEDETAETREDGSGIGTGENGDKLKTPSNSRERNEIDIKAIHTVLKDQVKVDIEGLVEHHNKAVDEAIEQTEEAIQFLGKEQIFFK